jgi:hypothetical protein
MEHFLHDCVVAVFDVATMNVEQAAVTGSIDPSFAHPSTPGCRQLERAEVDFRHS